MEKPTFKWLIIAYAMVGFSSSAWAQEIGKVQLYVAMELFLIPLIAVCIVWAVWTARAKSRVSDKARLDEAWRTVLSDPKYAHRRRYEEYNHNIKEQERKAEAQARMIEGL